MNKQDKEIYGWLTELRGLGETFNKMVGDLYPSICADEMNKLMYKLEHKHKIVVKWRQWGRHIDFINLNELIEKYGTKNTKRFNGSYESR